MTIMTMKMPSLIISQISPKIETTSPFDPPWLGGSIAFSRGFSHFLLALSGDSYSARQLQEPNSQTLCSEQKAHGRQFSSSMATSSFYPGIKTLVPLKTSKNNWLDVPLPKLVEKASMICLPPNTDDLCVENGDIP